MWCFPGSTSQQPPRQVSWALGRFHMATNEAFLRAILDNPEDDATRLVYADWLEEHGEAVPAEFIRVQCALARLSGSVPEHTESIQAGEYRVECESKQLSEAEQRWVKLR